MPRLTPGQLLIDPPASGPWNMAADEAMLDEAVQSGTTSLRFYQWQQPTLSLGYFQQISDRDSHPGIDHLQAVRRLTGGGAILHDWEITYAIAMPSEHPVTGSHQALYQIVHTSLVDVLQDFGISARQHREPCCTQERDAQVPPIGTTADATTGCQTMEQRESPKRDNSDKPFFCFQRLCHGDLLMHPAVAPEVQSGPPAKIAGSAQRRRKGALLQHGSVLLGRSPAAPELPGIYQLAGIQVPTSDLIGAWSPLLAVRLGLGLEPAICSDLALGEAIRHLQTRYTQASWTERR